MKHVYTSIDIGSDTVKVVVCEIFNNKLNLLAASSVKSRGVKKGLIVDGQEAVDSLKQALNEVESMLGIKIKKIITSIPGYNVDFAMIKGQLELSSEKEIDGSEISTVLSNAAKTKKSKGKEVVTILPVDFTVDENSSVKDPKGLKGDVLTTRAVIATSPRKNLASVISVIESCGLEVVDISLNSIGDMNAVKDKDVKDKVGAIINIGHETTSISLYNKGIIVKTSVIDRGGKNITSDISYIYKINSSDASKIKEKFALAHKKSASVNDTYDITNKNGEVVKINQYEVSEVVMARLEEILVLARKEINVLTNHEVDYILITGGTSNMTNFSKIAEEILGKNTKIGTIHLVGLRHNKYSTAVGNIVYFINKLKLKGKTYSMISKNDTEELVSSKRSLLNISNESMLGKVFGYFFNE
ncbi:MAG: cell division protein FtsA [Bacilli bacterium]